MSLPLQLCLMLTVIWVSFPRSSVLQKGLPDPFFFLKIPSLPAGALPVPPLCFLPPCSPGVHCHLGHMSPGKEQPWDPKPGCFIL